MLVKNWNLRPPDSQSCRLHVLHEKMLVIKTHPHCKKKIKVGVQSIGYFLCFLKINLSQRIIMKSKGKDNLIGNRRHICKNISRIKKNL